MGELVEFIPRIVNEVRIEQRVIDGFINATAMCTTHNKKIDSWFRTKEVFQLFIDLSVDLDPNFNYSNLSNLDAAKLSARKYSLIFPSLIVSRGGSPDNGGGTWLHPDLAIQLAQWCNSLFAIQVSRWVREWFTTGKNPVQAESGLDKEYVAWQERYDIRIELKDILRPELMEATRAYAVANSLSPITVCSRVHDIMNERIQGAKSRDIKSLNGLPLGDLLRDYFDTKPLHIYAAINRIAINKIVDSSINPIQAVNEACDVYLGGRYIPKLFPKAENLYAQGQRARKAYKTEFLPSHKQLNLFDGNQAV